MAEKPVLKCYRKCHPSGPVYRLYKTHKSPGPTLQPIHFERHSCQNICASVVQGATTESIFISRKLHNRLQSMELGELGFGNAPHCSQNFMASGQFLVPDVILDIHAHRLRLFLVCCVLKVSAVLKNFHKLLLCCALQPHNHGCLSSNLKES